MAVKRYHSALVVLHWLLAALILLALGMGGLVLVNTPNSDPAKIGALQGHMIGGGLIALLTLVRIVVRLFTSHPTPAPTGIAWADRVAPLMHWALYALVLVMAGSGIAMSIAFGLPDVVFGGAGVLPPDFNTAVARAVHGAAATALAALVVLHIAAALYHQLVRRDRLLARMGFGPRRA